MKRLLNRYRATTLPELLVVMILSGILFLLLFEGLNIITKYNRILSKRLTMKEELFYSHSTLEFFLEETDSARLSDEHTILLYKAGEVRRTLLFDSCGICLFDDSMKDTIFTNSIERGFHSQEEKQMNIDSIFIKTLVGKDTLLLEYGIPSNTNHLYTSSTHATNE